MVSRVVAGVVLAAAYGLAGAQVTPPDTAASAAIMSWETQEQMRDWLTVGLLGGALLAGFATAYKLT